MIKKKVVIEKADRLYQMPPDILSMIRVTDKPSLVRKTDQIDLATFDWPIRFDADLTLSADDLQPASETQLNDLKSALAEWMLANNGVKLKPDKDIFLGSGISSLIFSIGLAYLETGDIAFVPEVGLPLYRRVVIACGAEPISYPVTLKTGWSPDFDRITNNLRRLGQILFLNSPHNPTGSELDEKDFASLITLASRENVLIVNDTAYQSIPTRRPVSLLSVAGGKKVGVEVGSFSYLFGLPRLPFGFVAGNREVVAALNLTRSLTPISIPAYYANLALSAIRQYPNQELKELRTRISAAESEAALLLDKLSLENASGGTVPFVWAKIEKRSQSRRAAQVLFKRSRLLVAPGTGFGDNGEGYLRFSLTQPADNYTKAKSRIKKRISLKGSDDE